MKNTIHLILAVMLFACQSSAQTENDINEPNSQEFNDYWYAGKAELSSYTLMQSRYGEMHEGEAVLIFVTEDFSKVKQVKLDNPNSTPSDKVNVMKLNFTKKFNTGIYPYSMMYSCFTPVDIFKYPNSFKVTTSSQEWCGHTYLQLNKDKNHYNMAGYSYFESEGDYDKKLEIAMLEDEIWNKIRLNPSKLPTGEINVIPATFASRLMHFPLKKTKVTASLKTVTDEEHGNVLSYTLNYEKPKRILTIKFAENFPYQIIGWIETSHNRSGKVLTTKATLKKSMQLDYWNKNKPKDIIYREKLGLD